MASKSPRFLLFWCRSIPPPSSMAVSETRKRRAAWACLSARHGVVVVTSRYFHCSRLPCPLGTALQAGARPPTLSARSSTAAATATATATATARVPHRLQPWLSAPSILLQDSDLTWPGQPCPCSLTSTFVPLDHSAISQLTLPCPLPRISPAPSMCSYIF